MTSIIEGKVLKVRPSDNLKAIAEIPLEEIIRVCVTCSDVLGKNGKSYTLGEYSTLHNDVMIMLLVGGIPVRAYCKSCPPFTELYIDLGGGD